MTANAEKTIDPAAEPASPDRAPDKRRALGRGLDSLLPAGPRIVAPSAPASAFAPDAPLADGVVSLPLDAIAENPYQTRRVFDPAALQELAESIRASGVVQPVVVRPAQDGRYLLVLGERRCRASRLAGRTTIPAIIRRVSDQQAAELTIVENLQRQDLNCVEQAEAFARLSREFGLTQEQIGQRVGMARESVANYLRILKLPPVVLEHLAAGRLGFSEARVLLRLVDATLIPKIAERAVEKNLSVKQLEELVEHANSPAVPQPKPAPDVDPNVRAVQMELERALGVRVQIRDRNGKGKITIEYGSLEDFDRVIEMLSGKG
jgi:ParB family chromosome partitioning protein